MKHEPARLEIFLTRLMFAEEVLSCFSENKTQE